MSDRRMTVHEVADLTGITIRTLHYYDEIGLLKPTMVTDSKYRLYTDDDFSYPPYGYDNVDGEMVIVPEQAEIVKQNKGIVPQYYVENSHEPIIPRDLYMQVQEEMIRRANLHSGANRKKRVYSSKYALSSIVYCSKCGEIYRRIEWNNRGKHSTVWRCCTRVEHGPTACDAPTIQEQDLQAAVVQAINRTLGNRESMMITLQENVESVIRQEDETSSEGIETKLLELQKELLKLANSKKDYNSVADEIDRLRELKQNALVESAEREGLKQRIREMREFLEQQSTEVTEYDELLVRRLIEKVTVYDERFEVEFKSGAKVDVGR